MDNQCPGGKLWKPQVATAKAATHRVSVRVEKMKIKNVYDVIFSIDNFYGALEDASCGRRYKREVLRYNLDSYELLTKLIDEVLNGTYRIEKYHIFYIYEPKRRMIMSISFRHRIVQWAIYRVVNPMLVNGYINDSYGCIPTRGPLEAAQKLQYWLVYAERKEEKWYYLKLDISKYFYRILKEVLAKKIKDERLLAVLYNIIDCKHTPFGLPPGCSPGEVPLEERLFDVGMPIGNLMSQVFANVYLDVLDQFCKRVLRIDCYIRYVDDVIILSNSKAQLHIWKSQIEQFLLEKLELELNNKTCIRPVNQGIEFVGYRVWHNRIVIRKSTSLRIKRNLKGVRKNYNLRKITFHQATDRFQSYVGMLKKTDSAALLRKIYDDMVLTHASPKEVDIENTFYMQPCNGKLLPKMAEGV